MALAQSALALFSFFLSPRYISPLIVWHCLSFTGHYLNWTKMQSRKWESCCFQWKRERKSCALPRLCRPSGGKFSFPAALMPTLFAATNKTHFISSLSPPPSFFESARLLDLSFLILLTLID